MKWGAWVAVILIFLFPAISYLYLRSGFVYRKDALEELAQRNDFTAQQEKAVASLPTNVQNALNSDVFLIQKIQNDSDLKYMNFVSESLHKRQDFNLLAVFEEPYKTALTDTLYSRTLHRVALSKLATKQLFVDQDFLLLKDRKVRKTYLDSEEQRKLIYEQSVMLLPMKKREKITLKRDKEK